MSILLSFNLLNIITKSWSFSLSSNFQPYLCTIVRYNSCTLFFGLLFQNWWGQGDVNFYSVHNNIFLSHSFLESSSVPYILMLIYIHPLFLLEDVGVHEDITNPFYQLWIVFLPLLLFALISGDQLGQLRLFSSYLHYWANDMIFTRICCHKHLHRSLQFFLLKINSFLYFFTNQSNFPKTILEISEVLHSLFYIISSIFNVSAHKKLITLWYKNIYVTT